VYKIIRIIRDQDNAGGRARVRREEERLLRCHFQTITLKNDLRSHSPIASLFDFSN